MAPASRPRDWLPALWAGPAAVILAADYLSGPFVSLTIVFVIPVALAARFSGVTWGVTWGVLLPFIHFGFTFLRPRERTVLDALINAAIRSGVLVLFALLIDRTTRQAREIRVLRGHWLRLTGHPCKVSAVGTFSHQAECPSGWLPATGLPR